MPIDYETEYNNRARVPEHLEIFARWAREAEDYRAEAMKERRAELGLSYGSSLRQFIDLFSPSRSSDAAAPLALFIHGGYWRSLDPSMFSHMARGLNAHGVTVAVVGYDLCPEVTIAEIIDADPACVPVPLAAHEPTHDDLRPLRRRTSRRAMVATDWQALYPKAPPDLVPAAYSISGLFDLTPLVGITMAQDLRLDEAEARRVSPLFWPAAEGARLRRRRRRARNRASSCARAAPSPRQWGKAGAQTRYEAIAAQIISPCSMRLADPQTPRW